MPAMRSWGFLRLRASFVVEGMRLFRSSRSNRYELQKAYSRLRNLRGRVEYLRKYQSSRRSVLSTKEAIATYLGQTLVHGYSKIAGRVRRRISACQYLHQRLISVQARILQCQTVGGPVGPTVSEHAEDMTFAQHDVIFVGVDDRRPLGDVARSLVDLLVAYLVHRGDKRVQRQLGRVAGQPDGLAVERVVAARALCLLALVDEGDAVAE